MKLENKIVIITASTRGIGLACAEACARAGAHVWLAARNGDAAAQTVRRLREGGAKADYVYLDAARPESYVPMAETVARQCGRIDVLVNNFGGSDPVRDLDFAHTEPETFLQTVSLNLGSVFRASQAVLPHMMGHGGSIINISSIGGAVPDVSQVGYGTAKAAINHLTRLIALQEATHGIRCNAVLPGITATDAVQTRLSPEFRRQFLRHVPLGRMGLPREVAAAVVYLAGDEAAYVTGQLLHVSGGFAMGTPIYGDVQARRAASEATEKPGQSR